MTSDHSVCLRGKIALITGASKGIGKAIADEFVALGAGRAALSHRAWP